MWAAIGSWIVNKVLLPLAIKAATGIYDWIVDTIRKKRLDKENKKKVKDFINATNKNDIRDAYSKLP